MRVRAAPAGPARALPARPQPEPRPGRRPAVAPRIPRRVSGPARLRRATNPARALSDLALLDRLIKGRAWIAVVAFALIGIVTMQLALLKLNAGIGRALVHETALERENSALSVEQSEAGAADTLEHQAGQLGMQLIPAGMLRFLQGSEVDSARAIAALNADAARSAGAGTANGEAAAGASGEGSAGAGTASGEAAAGASGEGSAGAGTGSGEAAAGANGAGSAGAGTGSGEAAAGANGEGSAGAGTGSGEAAAGAGSEAATPSSPSPSAGSSAGAAEGGSAETGASASPQG